MIGWWAFQPTTYNELYTDAIRIEFERPQTPAVGKLYYILINDSYEYYLDVLSSSPVDGVSGSIVGGGSGFSGSTTSSSIN